MADGAERGASGFLADGGHAGALMRGLDLSASPLGPPEAWPQSLRSVVSLMLGSKFPMFVAWGPELGFLYNDPYAEILGTKHPAAMGRRFREIWAEIWDEIAPLIDAALAGSATFRENLPLTIRRRGFDEETWFTFSYSPVRDDAGRIAGMYCVCTETTAQVLAERDRKAALERLQSSEANYRYAVDLSPQTVWTAGPDGLLDHVGQRWEEWTGSSGLGTSWGDVLHPEDLQPSIDAWTRSITTGVPYDIWHRARMRDGSYRWMHSRAFPRRDETGEVVRWYGTTEDADDARRASEALAESERRFRNMADHAPVMMWVTDPSGHCTYLNRSWYEFTGQTRQEAEGFGWLDATHPDDKAAADEAFRRANTAQAPFRVEYRLRRADGNYRWAIDAASPRFDTDGTFLGYVGSVIDIDERREMERALHELNATLEQRVEERTRERDRVWNVSQDLLVICGFDGLYRLVNPAWGTQLGYNPVDLVGTRFDALVHPDDADTSRAAFEQLTAGTIVEGIDIRLLARDGSYRWYSWTCVPEGNWFYAAGRDVTQRRTLEERVARALAEQKAADALYRAYFQNSAEALFVIGVSTDGRFLVEELNPTHEQVTGYSTAEHRGVDLADLLAPDVYEQVVRYYRLALETGEVQHYQDAFNLHGETRHWDTILVPVCGQDGRIERIIGSSRDKTAQVRAEEALRQSQKMEAVGQLTGGIAHDFNNLLTGIVGSLELIQRRIAEGRFDAVDRYASVAMTSSHRAAALTQRLLAFSRRQPLDPKPVLGNRLVSSMEELLRRTLGPQIELELVLAGGLWPTLCDPNQLENAILNLAINARDAMPEGGRLTVETANAHLDGAYARTQGDGVEPGQYVSISVTDTGSGITPDVAARIFEPFFTTKPIGQGTGLGLSQLYGFVKQSGGHVAVYTEVGQGTTFRIYLPRHRGPLGAEDEAAQAEAALPAAEGECVLVVEDEAAVRMLITETLGDLGYQAVEAVDGPSGLKALESAGRIDLLVTDVGLPGLNGRQLADAARAQRPDLKVLFITGFAGNAAVGNGVLEPGMEMMTKPFAMDQLANKIREMIEG